MKPAKRRWSKTYEAAEEELLRFLEAKNLHPQRIDMSEFEERTESASSASIELWCAEGSAECKINGTSYALQAGDYLYVPIGSGLTCSAGFSGCVLYQKTD